MSPREHRHRNGQTDTAESGTDNAGSLGTPGGLHELLWQQIEDRMVEIVMDLAVPTLGTVVGMDGGSVRVQLDEEDDVREVGFPKVKGTRHDPGERVPVFKTRGGRQFLLPPVIDQQGQAERAVDDADIHDDAIATRHIGDNQVTGGKIPNREIKSDHLSTKNSPGGAAVQSGNIGDKQVKGDHIDNKQIDSSHLKDSLDTDIKDAVRDSGNALDKIGDKQKGTGLYGDVDAAKSAASDAKGDVKNLDDKVFGQNGLRSDVNANKNDITALTSKIKKLEDRVKKLESHS